MKPEAATTTTTKWAFSLGSALALYLLAGCASVPEVTERTDQNRDSITQVTQNYDTFGRRWGTVETTQNVVAPPPRSEPPRSEPRPAERPPVKQTCASINTGLVNMTKTVPAEVALGQEFMYELNPTAVACAGNVVITDHIPVGATYVRSVPPAEVQGEHLVWRFHDMDPGESKPIKVWLRADKEGTLTSCATVSAEPRVCASTRVVNPAIQLTKTEPKDVVICDPIPVVLVVKNIGSSQLTGVKVADSLPAGLSSDGKSSLVFDAGSLAPGESKEFKFNAMAASPGHYDNSANATSDQRVSAKAAASTTVHQPVLTLSCKAREQQFIGRSFEVCFTVSNTGDAAAAGTQVAVPVPAGLTFNSATAGGRLSGNNVVWDVGSLAENAPKELCASFTSAGAGTFSFNGMAKGTCAKQVSTSCQTKVVGVTALLLEKADHPDPIQVGETTTYTVKVTNQGTADDTNVKVVVEFPAEIDPVSASHGGVIGGKTVTFPAYPRLAPKQAFEYSVIARGVKVGDVRVRFIRTSDGIPAPTTAEESTRVY